MDNSLTLEIYHSIIDSISEGVCVINTTNEIQFINKQLSNIMGYSRQELLGRSVFQFVRIDEMDTFVHRLERRKKGHKAAHSYLLKCKGGVEKWVTMNARPIIIAGEFQGLIITILDTSEEKRNAELMTENFRHYVSLFEDSPIAIWDEDFSQIKIALDQLKSEGVHDLPAYFSSNPEELTRVASLIIVNNINKAVVEINEAASKQEVLDNFKKLITGDSFEYIMIQLEAIAEGKTSCEFDAVLKTLRGNNRFVHLKWSVVQGYEKDYSRIYLSTTDLTDRIIEENLMLQRSNQEKEMLLKEIHHRVKNNLQIISSLLKLQSNAINDEFVNEIFSASLNRINSMAKVHELLYQSTEFSEINYNDYLEALIASLIETMSAQKNKIQVDLQVQNIAININTAIPLGLLINEVVTNSIKHGLINDSEGLIYVHIHQVNSDEFTLLIGDNGVGFSLSEAIERKETLGMSLIESLAEQLNGKMLQLSHASGTHFRLDFSKLP